MAGIGILARWPITLLLGVLLVVAAIKNNPFRQAGLQKIWLLVPFVFPFAIIAAGARFQAPAGEFREGFAWQANVVYLLFLLHIIVGIWVIYRLRGLRCFASGVIMMQLWFSCMCSAVALIGILNVFI